VRLPIARRGKLRRSEKRDTVRYRFRNAEAFGCDMP